MRSLKDMIGSASKNNLGLRHVYYNGKSYKRVVYGDYVSHFYCIIGGIGKQLFFTKKRGYDFIAF